MKSFYIDAFVDSSKNSFWKIKILDFLNQETNNSPRCGSPPIEWVADSKDKCICKKYLLMTAPMKALDSVYLDMI